MAAPPRGQAGEAGPAEPRRKLTRAERRVVLGSAAGTVFEWYDFYLYGALAAVIGARFFSGQPEAIQTILALLAFAAGFLVRPIGALVFGRLGDRVGRKYAFLVTILIMGFSTFAVGLLPTAEDIGPAAALLLVGLRLAQGLALGGEYGGAATYLAEHAPQGRRGLVTAFLQVTATAGLLAALVVILALRLLLGEAAFEEWGWRIPFLLSAILLGISIWIRLHLEESPAFIAMKRAGTASRRPLAEAFGQWRHARLALVALFGLVAGQAVVWYAGQFYALLFLGSVKVEPTTAQILVACSLLLGAPGFFLFGWLSDRIGRKPVILGGCALAALALLPLFHALGALANPALARAQATVPVVVAADPAACSLQFNPLGTRPVQERPCDATRAALAAAAVAYRMEGAPAGGGTTVRVADGPPIPWEAGPAFADRLRAALAAAGYPGADNPGVVALAHPLDLFRPQPAAVIGILTLLVLLVTMVYGPIAAALVELFPTRIRCTGVSLPYHLGNGWFGGLVPAMGFALVAESGDPYRGLWYPIAIAAATAVIGALLVPETKDRDILAGDGAPESARRAA